MKRDNFIEDITKSIETKRNIKAGLRKELSDIQNEIESLRTQIGNYTDATDVDTYTKMKNTVEVLENRQELIKRNLDAESKAPADVERITSDYAGFMAEKKRLENIYSEQMIEIIRKLKAVFDESEVKKGSLKTLYDGWIQTFNIPSNYYQNYDPMDGTGVSSRVRQLLNSMDCLNIL